MSNEVLKTTARDLAKPSIRKVRTPMSLVKLTRGAYINDLGWTSLGADKQKPTFTPDGCFVVIQITDAPKTMKAGKAVELSGDCSMYVRSGVGILAVNPELLELGRVDYVPSFITVGQVIPTSVIFTPYSDLTADMLPVNLMYAGSVN